MINLLPPEYKEQVRYSKYNVVLLRYLLLLVVAGGLLVSTLWIVHRYADNQISDYQDTLAERRQGLEQYSDLKQEVEQLDQRLDTISQLYDQQTRFSTLLEDLAAVLPSGAYINNIVLTGESDQPVQVLISASSFEQAGVIKNALTESPRIDSVDIQNIDRGDNNYTVNVVMAFSEGGAQ